MKGVPQQPAEHAKAAAANAGLVTHVTSLEKQASGTMLTDHNADGNAHDDITEPDVFESDLHNATCSTQDALSMWLEYSSDIPLADALSELPWIRLDVLTLTMECLASSRSVRVMKVGHILRWSVLIICAQIILTLSFAGKSRHRHAGCEGVQWQ